LIINNDFFTAPSSADALGLFNGFDAYPRSWIDDGSGNLVYGSIQPQMKDALSFLATLYSEGLIENDFAVKDFQKTSETPVSGKGGIQYGANWNSIWPLQGAIDNNPNAVWTPIAIPSATGNAVKAQTRLNIDEYFVVSKKCEHPEALFKLLNFYVEKFTTGSAEEYAKYLVNDTGAETFDLHGTMFKMYPPLRNLEAYANVQKALETKDSTSLNAEDLNYYNSVVAFMNGDLTQAGGAKVFGPGGSEGVLTMYYENDLFLRDKFFGAPTTTMGQKMQLIKDKEMEYFTKVIMGEDSVDNFDQFVADLNALGLDQITIEVNEWNNR
jgi:putative aldouronate transport system substrate-binding protein